MKITTLVDRFGSNRLNAAEPAKYLRGCSHISIPFAGGMCEVPHFNANIILVNDLDAAVMNLARQVRDNRQALTEWLDGTPYHLHQLGEDDLRAFVVWFNERVWGDPFGEVDDCEVSA